MNNHEFYELLIRCCDGIAVITAFKEDGSKEFFQSNDPNALESAVSRLNKTCKSVYIDRNLRRLDLPPNIRGGDEDVIVVNAITFDCDILGPAHKETQLPATREEDPVIPLTRDFAG